MKINIALIKMLPEKGNLPANQSSLMTVLQRLDPESVDVVITPECFLDGYVCTEDYVTPDNIPRYAIDPQAADYTQEISAWAKATNTWVIYGCLRVDSMGVYNTALAFNRTGNLVGHYDKVHCQTHDQKYMAGNNLPVFDSDFGPFGMMICADRRWPETVRTLALGGARIIFNPTYGMHDDRNLHMMQTRSYESEVFIAFAHPQQSLITDPRGDIVINHEEANADFVIAEVDLALVDHVRSGQSAHLRDRRGDVYCG